MADPATLYQDLKNALTHFEDFINPTSPTGIAIINAVKALRVLHAPIDDLLDKLITLMLGLSSAIASIDPSKISAVGDLTAFTTALGTLLDSADVLVPQQSTQIKAARDALTAVTALQSLTTELYNQIVTLLGTVTLDLRAIKAA
jgi:hypothetical protein